MPANTKEGICSDTWKARSWSLLVASRATYASVLLRDKSLSHLSLPLSLSLSLCRSCSTLHERAVTRFAPVGMRTDEREKERKGAWNWRM